MLAHFSRLTLRATLEVVIAKKILMKVKELAIVNFRRLEQVNIDCESTETVFVVSLPH